jgi:hypothetical protein
MKSLLLFTLAVMSLAAAEPPKTLLTLRGKLLLSEDFAQPITFAKAIDRKAHPGIWTPGWRVMNGTWTQGEGGIRGIVLPKIYPAATLHLPLAYQDVIIQVEVRLDDIPLDDPPAHNSISAKVVLREANAAHIASAQLSKNGFSAAKDKTNKRMLNGTLVDDAEVSFGRHTDPIKPGEWRTVVIEVRGEEMLSTLDGRHPVFGTHPILGIGKGILSFGTPRSASFRHLRVWEALPNPDWPKHRRALPPRPGSP